MSVQPPLPGDDLISQIAAATLRHCLSGLGGSLLVAGAIQPDQQKQFEAIGLGLGMWVFGLVWSYIQKRMKRA